MGWARAGDFSRGPSEVPWDWWLSWWRWLRPGRVAAEKGRKPRSQRDWKPPWEARPETTIITKGGDPKPKPTPKPDPKPTPKPTPKADPVPEPGPEVTPEVQPAPEPDPEPTPEVQPAPEPEPVLHRNPIPTQSRCQLPRPVLRRAPRPSRLLLFLAGTSIAGILPRAKPSRTFCPETRTGWMPTTTDWRANSLG